MACFLCALMWLGAAAGEEQEEAVDSITFAWGHLSTLSDKENDLLQRLLEVVEIQTCRQETDQGEYVSWDILLQEVSVFDIAFQVLDGLYSEHSSLLEGRTVTFSPAEMASFLNRLSARSSGLLPGEMHPAIVLLLLALDNGFTLPDTPAYAQWKENMPVHGTVRQPKVYIQPLYGVRADTVTYGAEAIIQWVEIYLQSVRTAGNASERSLSGGGMALSESLGTLPETLRETLAAEPPLVLRTIYDADDRPVAYQAEGTFPQHLQFFLEWSAEASGLPSAYLTLSTDAFSCKLLIAAAENRTVAEGSFVSDDFSLNVMYTAVENVSAERAGQTGARREWMLQSDAWFGEDALVTITAESVTTSATTRRRQTRKTDWYVQGLAPGATEKVLTVTRQTDSRVPTSRLDVENAVRPGQMDDAALDAWLLQTEDNYMQGVFTLLGRLPSDVAEYLLGMLEQ